MGLDLFAGGTLENLSHFPALRKACASPPTFRPSHPRPHPRPHPPSSSLPATRYLLPPLMLRPLQALCACLLFLWPMASSASPAPSPAPQPLYRDPIHDGAADPVVIWNPIVERWWLFYTNRRANVPGLSGVAWVHGTAIGIAESADAGRTWSHIGTAQLELPDAVAGPPATRTHWAPEVVTAPDGTHHMFLTVVPGIFETWDHPRRLTHLTSPDLRHWTYRSTLDLASDRVIAAAVVPLPTGGWRLWYNDERRGKAIAYADSPDLSNWTDHGRTSGFETAPSGKGPTVFRFGGQWWMVVDHWRGLGVYHSPDLTTWTAQPGDFLLATPGRGPDDDVNGGHASVRVTPDGTRAFLFYFTHPGRAGTITPAAGDDLDRRRSSILTVELFLTAAGHLTCDRDQPTALHLVPPPAAITRTTIAPAAFAGSSINTPPGFHQSLVSNGRRQYAGYYAPDGTVVIAARDWPAGAWTTHPTPFRGNPADAHNTIALGLDGTGALHLAWGHHNIPLNYARSTPAAPLTFGDPSPMVGRHESRVTYPQFLPLPAGDLLFVHRDGGSGRGNLLLNHYAATTATWTRLHDNLIDGENARSAYPAFYIDRRGTLHLAWTWRRTPDVATNHDLAYARSPDGGRTWTDAADRPLTPPFTAAHAAYAARIPENSRLMNPPALAATAAGRPLLLNYWSPGPGEPPRYHLLSPTADGTAWTTRVLEMDTINFTLGGTGTRRPPYSRGVFLATARGGHFLFRHDTHGAAAIVISAPDLADPTAPWTTTVLPTGDLGGWEPSADAHVAAHHESLEFLVQPVTQRDGNDHEAAPAAPTPLTLLRWLAP